MNPYPDIADYALISDCHCNALISRNGSVDWSCMPRMDDDSTFARILDWERGGYCLICPFTEGFATSRRYIDGSMILETTFRTDTGEVRLTDFFVVGDGDDPEQRHYDHVRLVDGISGTVEMRVEVVPRFDYGEITPYVKQYSDNIFTATGSNQGLIVHSDFLLDEVDHQKIEGRVHVAAGCRARLGIRFSFPERLDADLKRGLPSFTRMDAYLDMTLAWWTSWSKHMHSPFPVDSHTVRSAIVLKGLTFEPTGAIAAASTTSLPEWIGGTRNWDYRFSWVRDSVFTIRALHELGYDREADRFHQFIARSASGSAAQLQIMYGIDGKRRLTESELPWLEGYRSSRPVRIGNAAAKQSQLDIYGELLEMAWQWHESGHSADPSYYDFLIGVVDHVCHIWTNSDHGIWEVRGEPLHYVHSKVMCWAALNRGIQLAQANQMAVPLQRWIENRDMLRKSIEQDGYDEKRGIFLQAFHRPGLDAALLILPRVGFVDHKDPRMLRTVDAIRSELESDGLLLRYRGPDGIKGPEGIFLPCTFWLVECLAHQGRLELARTYYERVLRCCNDLELFSEEFDVGSGQMLGNFPQGLTHVSQIMAWLALQKAGLRDSR